MSKLSRRLEALASAVNQLNQNSNVAIGNKLKVEVQILKFDATQNSNNAIGNKLKVEVKFLNLIQHCNAGQRTTNQDYWLQRAIGGEVVGHI